MNLEYIYEQMVRILHGNITCISESGAIEACYGDMAVQCNPLFTDPEFLSAVHERERKDYPDLFYEKDTILYAVVSLENAKIVAGPVSTEKHTKDSEHYLMQHHHISDETGFRLSFCELKVFGSGILMLYHMITGKELTINDLWQKNGIRETDIIEVKGQISSVIFEHQEQELPHNPYDQEVRELDSIRHGDVEMFNRSLAETYRGEVGQLAKNQVRQAKNIAICVIALASRAAISGGMIPEEAFSMVDSYIMKIEDMNNAVKIDSMMRQAEYEFAECVAEIHKNQQKNEQKNELVEWTKNYIYQNLHSDIVIYNVEKAHCVVKTRLDITCSVRSCSIHIRYSDCEWLGTALEVRANRCCEYSELILCSRLYTDYRVASEHIWSDIKCSTASVRWNISCIGFNCL